MGTPSVLFSLIPQPHSYALSPLPVIKTCGLTTTNSQRGSRAFHKMIGYNPGPPLWKRTSPVAILIARSIDKLLRLAVCDDLTGTAGIGLGRVPFNICDVFSRNRARFIEGPILLNRYVPRALSSILLFNGANEGFCRGLIARSNFNFGLIIASLE